MIAVLLLAPPVLISSTYAVFRLSARWWGAAAAHWLGFLCYWLGWCLLLPALTVGRAGLRQMFAAPQPPERPLMLVALLVLLAGPPLLMFLTRFAAEMRGASLAFLLISILYALANGTLEEVLWRGTYLVAFPTSWLWGWLYPAIGFGLWHVAPLAADLDTRLLDSLPFAFMSIGLGLLWGWVARTTGSIRWPVAAHILLNFAWPAAADFLPGR